MTETTDGEKPEAKPEEFTTDRGASDRVEAKAEPEAKPEPKDEEPKAEKPEAKAEKPEEDDELPIGIKKRVARAQRQRDDAKRERDEFAERIAVLEGMVERLKKRKTAEIDPLDFETSDEYEAAKKEAAEPVEVEEQPRDPEFYEAAGDLKEAVQVSDPDLWAEVTAGTIENPKVNGITREIVIALADADDPTAALRALVAMDPAARAELSHLSPRAVRREIKGLAAPKRDDKGRFQAKKQSAAEPPITPESGGAPRERPLSEVGFEEFERRRNEAERVNTRHGW